MRIKDLATRATKLLTGNAYMVVDNGTKVEKIDYAELAKQIITEYNTQTLAGSAQSVKAAIDALNSNLVSIPNPSNNRLRYRSDTDCNLLIDEWALGSGSNYPPGGLFWYIHSIAYVTNTNGSIKIGKQIAYGYSVDKVIYERTCSSGVWNEWTQLPTRSEVDALNSNVGTLSGIKTVVVNDTTNDVGIITLNVGAFTGRPYVISNISANFVTPYRIICDSWTASTGSISIRVRKSTDNAAVANTTIQDTILIIFSR